MKEPNYKQNLIKKIDVLLTEAMACYLDYKNHLKDYEEEPKFFLDKEKTDRTTVLLKLLYLDIDQINMLLKILFNQKFISISSLTDLTTYNITKKIIIDYIIEKPFMKTGKQTKRIYKYYNALTGKLKKLPEELEMKLSM